LRQHHLQYTGGLAETQGLLLPSYIVTLSMLCTVSFKTDTNQFFPELLLRDYCSYQNDRSSQNVVLQKVYIQKFINGRQPTTATQQQDA
jgi:hypothetical protein